MKASFRQVRPLSFFLLTYLLSWLIWIPLVLSHFGIGPLRIAEGISNVVRLLGVLMPAAAGLILTGITNGKSGIRALFQRLTLWRVGWRWWGAAALIQPALLVLAALTYNLLVGKAPIAPILPESAVGYFINIIFLLIATLGEEIGWRGVALPSLQERHNALTSSAILGLLWAVWHIPFWLLLETLDQFGPIYLVLNFLLLPLTFYISWIFNHTRSSLLMPVVFHLTFNIVNSALLPVTSNLSAFALFIALEWIGAVLILRHLEPDYTSRWQLFVQKFPINSTGNSKEKPS